MLTRVLTRVLTHVHAQGEWQLSEWPKGLRNPTALGADEKKDYQRSHDSVQHAFSRKRTSVEWIPEYADRLVQERLEQKRLEHACAHCKASRCGVSQNGESQSGELAWRACPCRFAPDAESACRQAAIAVEHNNEAQALGVLAKVQHAEQHADAQAAGGVWPHLECVDARGSTLLHSAAAKGLARVVARLLELGANLLAVDRRGSTALHYACERGHRHCAEQLLLLGAADRTRVPELLAKQDENGYTALHRACYNHQQACVKLLLEPCGASSERAADREATQKLLAVCAKENCTALHSALSAPSHRGPNTEILEKLLAHMQKVDIDALHTDPVCGGMAIRMNSQCSGPHDDVQDTRVLDLLIGANATLIDPCTPAAAHGELHPVSKEPLGRSYLHLVAKWMHTHDLPAACAHMDLWTPCEGGLPKLYEVAKKQLEARDELEARDAPNGWRDACHLGAGRRADRIAVERDLNQLLAFALVRSVRKADLDGVRQLLELEPDADPSFCFGPDPVLRTDLQLPESPLAAAIRALVTQATNSNAHEIERIFIELLAKADPGLPCTVSTHTPEQVLQTLDVANTPVHQFIKDKLGARTAELQSAMVTTDTATDTAPAAALAAAATPLSLEQQPGCSREHNKRTAPAGREGTTRKRPTTAERDAAVQQQLADVQATNEALKDSLRNLASDGGGGDAAAAEIARLNAEKTALETEKTALETRLRAREQEDQQQQQMLPEAAGFVDGDVLAWLNEDGADGTDGVAALGASGVPPAVAPPAVAPPAEAPPAAGQADPFGLDAYLASRRAA